MDAISASMNDIGLPSTAILIAVRNSTDGQAALREWAQYVRESTLYQITVWVLCVKNSRTETLVRDLHDLQPFVVEAEYNWAAVIRDFDIQVKVSVNHIRYYSTLVI